MIPERTRTPTQPRTQAGRTLTPRTEQRRQAGVLGAVGEVLRRALEALAVLLVLVSLVFLALRILPGDPVALVLGDHATSTDRARMAAELHLDEPLVQQYARFLFGLVTFDLGPSIRRPDVGAIARVGTALLPTVGLATASVVLGAALGITGALLARGPWFPRARVWMSRLFVGVAAVPLLALAPVVTYLFVIKWRVLPLPGDPDAGLVGFLFPACLLALPLGAHTARIGEEALARTERAPFMTVARAKGAGSLRVWGLHALPTVIAPIVTTIAAQLGALLGGAVVLERLFERPGLGRLILDAYLERDLPVLEAAVAAAGLLFVVTQIAGAALVAAIDPRARGR